MISVIPAVIPQTSRHLTETLAAMTSWTKEIQIDIVDGVFVPHVSWPYTEHAQVSVLSEYTRTFDIEVDFMVQDTESVLRACLETGIARAIVHLEAVRDVTPIVALKQQYDFALGFAVGNDTPLALLEQVIGYADYVQLMGIAAIGSQGQPFDVRVLDRIRAVRHGHRALPISIDGGVTSATIPALVEAGADRLISGSAIMRASDPCGAYETLSRLANA
jgi:ribulose-phosphate 3-epimerase